jgi:hypothetical protein
LNRCPFCGEGLRRPPRDEQSWDSPFRPQGYRRDWEPHRGTLVLVLGTVSIGMAMVFTPLALPFGVAAWILGQSDLRKMKRNDMDPAGKGNTEAGWICGIIGTCLGLIPVVICCGILGIYGVAAALGK